MAPAAVKARDPLAALRAQNRARGGGVPTSGARRPVSSSSSAPAAPQQGGASPGRIAQSRIVYFTSQLAVMLQTGIPLSHALEGMRRQEKHPGLQEVIGQLQGALERGEPFSAALSRFPRLFDQSYVAMVKAAEVSGNLGPVMERLATGLRKSLETRARVRAAMAYPVVMLVLAIGVCVFLLSYVIPRFAPLFQARGALLPTPTRIVLAISHALVGYWHIWVGGIVAVGMGYAVALRSQAGRRHIDRIKLRLPIVGPVVRKAALSQAIRTLGTLLSGGVTMLEALRLTGEAAGNAEFCEFWQRVEAEVTGGKALSDLLGNSPLIPPTVAQMVSAGEESGKLPEVLTKLADHLEADVDIAIKAATSMIEPLLIAVMGVVVGTIGMAVVLPIFTLSRPM